MTLFSPAPAAGPTDADWMRGAVAALLPRGWLFELVEGFGGSAFLVVKPDRSHDAAARRKLP